MIRRRDGYADNLVKMYLSMFSILQFIMISKKTHFQFKTIVKGPTTQLNEICHSFWEVCMDLAERYIPWVFDIPMECGLRWLPQWSSSSVSTQGNRFISTPKGNTPFHRMIWDIFSVAMWDRMTLQAPTWDKTQRAAGNLWPFQPGFLDWAVGYITPLFCFFAPDRVVLPQKGRDDPDDVNFPWSMYSTVQDLGSKFCRSAAILSELLVFSMKSCFEKVRAHDRLTDEEILTKYAPGRLAFKEEGAGKAFSISRSLRFRQLLNKLFCGLLMIGVCLFYVGFQQMELTIRLSHLIGCQNCVLY